MAIPTRPPARPGASVLKPGEDPLAKSKREKEELAGEVGRLEEEVEELKVRYEMYFLGNERREPIRDREELKKRVLRAKEGFTRNAGLRFRIQSLHARFLSYERLWLRSGREKEEGTYRRDLFKARLHARGKAPVPAAAPGAGGIAGMAHAGPTPAAVPAPADPFAAAGAAPAPAPAGHVSPTVNSTTTTTGAPSARPAPRPNAPPAARAPGGKLGDAELRAIYDQYVAAKKRCNEDVSKLSYDAVARSVAKQVPELMAKHKASSVDFKVVVKDGKAVLKAIPRS